MDCVASMDCLPDDLLIQILSFLPTKKAASTSVLSKRWRSLFAFSPNLDFDDSMFLHPEANNLLGEYIPKSFDDFVDRRLALQGGNHIKKFSLKLQQDYVIIWYMESFNRCICNALEHGVSELHLAINPLNRSLLHMFQIPCNIFTSTTLVNLSLGTKQYIPNLPSDTSLPSLKVLLLDTIFFEGNELSDVLLSACPALEDLTIFHRTCPVVLYVISSKTIKRISVICYCDFYGYGYDSCILSLDTPNLVELYYSDYARKRYPHCNSNSLVKATLDLYFSEDYVRRKQNDTDVTDLISGIRNVKTLILTSSAVEVISMCCKGGLPVFNNLVDLVFSSKKRGWIKLLPLLLERSPNLKNLVLWGLNCYTFNRKHRFVGTHIPPNNQIKMLSIRQYEGSENELKHISHFFLNMKFLQVVKVYVAPSMDNPKKMQLTENLLKLPAASSELEIQVM